MRLLSQIVAVASGLSAAATVPMSHDSLTFNHPLAKTIGEASHSVGATTTSHNITIASSSHGTATTSHGSERTTTAAPQVMVKNGTVQGIHNTQYKQDFFLGVPFAQAPVGDLRFVNPQSINKTFASTLQANAYAPECVGYGGDDIDYPSSEDCLYLNVIRPAGYENQSLPVGVWIHGGVFFEGGTRDERYNLSFIVNNSVAIDKPIIGVSIAYRLSAFGFLASQEVTGSGNTNMGLRDQRLALHYIQENIHAFGGDPAKVTIWGESAGAWSVGGHLIAYNGRNDSLFRAAIMESGNPINYQNYRDLGYYQPQYNSVVNQTGCTDTADTLACLRRVPLAKLNQAFNTSTVALNWQPIVDGDFIQRFGSIQLQQGAFVKVPIIDGTNTDEGTAFSPTGVNNTQDFIQFVTAATEPLNIPSVFMSALLNAYPNNSSDWIPPVSEVGNITYPLPYGKQYRRSASYYGDAVMIANRRATCEAWAAAGLPVYSYRFNTVPAGISYLIGVTHFQEVAFVMDNTRGNGYNTAHNSTDPFLDKPQSYFELAQLMSSSWASFIYDMDPNGFKTRFSKAAPWPLYNVTDPQNIVWDANVTELAYAEPDTYRKAGMQFIMDHALAYRR